MHFYNSVKNKHETQAKLDNKSKTKCLTCDFLANTVGRKARNKGKNSNQVS